MSANKQNTSEEQVFRTAVDAIRQQAAQRHQREVIVLSGDSDWCDTHAGLIVAMDAEAIVEWVGKDQDAQRTHKQHFSAKLGREVDIMIFPLTPDFDANRLTALSGMIRGGGLLVFLLTKDLWNSASHFDQRFIHALHQRGIHWLQENKMINIAANMESNSLDSGVHRNDKLFLTEQAELVNQLIQLNSKYDKATLVIQSDRGRGKSAALGIAAAKWLAAGESVHLTGPSLKSVEQVFWHAQQELPKADASRGCLTYQNESLQFLPPDAVHTKYKNIKRLLVDEAAAIPIPKLTNWLQHIPQLVFSTTIHGYEGTGKGFLLKFGKVLEQQRPDWHKFKLQHPIRWASDDFLEQWLNQTFLLDVDIVALPTSFPWKRESRINTVSSLDKTLAADTMTDRYGSHNETRRGSMAIGIQNETTIDKTLAAEFIDSGFDEDLSSSFRQRQESSQHLNLEYYNSYNLANDDDLLKQVYGLLINAHYRTTPKDLRYLLDTETASVYALWQGQQLLAAAWVMYEGDFEQELSDAVYLGTRRPPGHLLAQSLTYHCAIQDAATYRYARIVRIAVHLQCQRQGLGSQLLQHIIKSEPDVDAIGTSFSATPEGLDFWRQNQFVPVRIGMTRHQSSGEHSVMLLHAVSDAGQRITETARNRMLDALPFHLQEPLADLDRELVTHLADTEVTINNVFSDDDWQELVLFAYANRTYAEALGPLVKLARLSENDNGILTEAQQRLFHAKVLQHKSWEEVVATSNLDGQKQAVQILRAAVSVLLLSKVSKELMTKIDWVKQQIATPAAHKSTEPTADEASLPNA